MPIRTCLCGSGLSRFEIVDAAGIFCTFACDRCEEEKRKKFNPAIFESGSPYAASGEEADIGSDWHDW